MDEKLYIRALRFLTSRPRSEKEVREYLLKLQKNVEREEVEKTKLADTVIVELRKQKYVDDVKFATWWIEQRSRFRPKGRFLITLELSQKGVSKGTVEEAYATLSPEEKVSEGDLAKKVALKRLDRLEGLSFEEKYQKLSGFLARRGFSGEVVKTCVDQLLRK